MQIAPETTTAEVETKPTRDPRKSRGGITITSQEGGDGEMNLIPAETKPARRPRAKKGETTEAEPFIPVPGEAPDVVDSQTATSMDARPVEESPETARPATQTGEKVESIQKFGDASESVLGDSATLDPREPETVVATAPVNHYPDHYVEANDVWKKNVKEAERYVQETEADWIEAKTEASAKKKTHEAAIAALRRAVSSEPEKLPLFDGPPKSIPSPSVATPKPDDRWRAWKLEDVEDLPGGSLAAFDAANLVTMGDLITWQGKGNRLEDLPGIGDVKADKIAECLVRTHEIRPWDRPIVAEAVADESDEDDEDESFDDDDFEDDSDFENEPDDE